MESLDFRRRRDIRSDDLSFTNEDLEGQEMLSNSSMVTEPKELPAGPRLQRQSGTYQGGRVLITS